MIVIDKNSDLGKMQTYVDALNEKLLKVVQAVFRKDKDESLKRCKKLRLYLFMLLGQLDNIEAYIENDFQKVDLAKNSAPIVRDT